jgi:hypothetical protein
MIFYYIHTKLNLNFIIQLFSTTLKLSTILNFFTFGLTSSITTSFYIITYLFNNILITNNICAIN